MITRKETEASKLHCPLIGENCITSKCMAWKFTRVISTRETELWSKSRNKKVNSAFTDDADWRPVDMAVDAEPPAPRGVCTYFDK